MSHNHLPLPSHLHQAISCNLAIERTRNCHPHIFVFSTIAQPVTCPSLQNLRKKTQRTRIPTQKQGTTNLGTLITKSFIAISSLGEHRRTYTTSKNLYHLHAHLNRLIAVNHQQPQQGRKTVFEGASMLSRRRSFLISSI